MQDAQLRGPWLPGDRQTLAPAAVAVEAAGEAGEDTKSEPSTPRENRRNIKRETTLYLTKTKLMND